MEGWIKLHRKLLENDLWKSEPFTRGQAWVDLILLANHKDSFFYKRGNKVNVLRGQVGRSIVELSDRWKWSRSKVNKFLKDLEKEQQIKQQKNNVTQILTVINYDNYQEKEQHNEQQKDTKRTPKEHQKDTYKNVKNDNNEKEKDLTSPKGDFDFEKFLQFINKTLGRKLRSISNSEKQKVKARLKEGYTKEDFKNAVLNVKNVQIHIESNYRHCDIEFFARPKTLNQYGHNPVKKNSVIGAKTEYYVHD